ncbi:unnamed protein product [Spirodela intermedia]|uniref:Uncharacterized protein n=1 Tax=Spirodela intermedia TaxID=51605 RepID=A0A7I8JJQ1_SPIIN|nr:unnamed protein product [Spirodela intermedia]CAA6670374.1 unnamed protein product [Spirodela intermedia]
MSYLSQQAKNTCSISLKNKSTNTICKKLVSWTFSISSSLTIISLLVEISGQVRSFLS